MSDPVDVLLRRVEADARRRLEQASMELGHMLADVAYNLNPLTVASRTAVAAAMAANRMRPPLPDQVAEALARGAASPEELARGIAEVLPTPKQLVELAMTIADPVTRTQKVTEAVENVALPASILVGSIIVAIAIAIAMLAR